MVRFTYPLHPISHTCPVYQTVDVLFSAGLEPLCRKASARRRQWGQRAELVSRVLFELHAMAHLADAALLPGIRVDNDGSSGRYTVTHMEGLALTVIANPEATGKAPNGGPLETVTGFVVEAVRFLTEEDPEQ
jgi:hypothetical protein